jgi:hypothetical protein
VTFSVRPSILLNNKVFTPGGELRGELTPRGQISPLGARGEVKNGPQSFPGLKKTSVDTMNVFLQQDSLEAI